MYMATARKRRKRRKNKRMAGRVLLFGGLVIILLGVLLAVQIKKGGTGEDEGYVMEENEDGTNASANGKEAEPEEVVPHKEDPKEESLGEDTPEEAENGEDAPGNNPAESTPEETAQPDAEGAGAAPQTVMNADGVTWTSFDGITMGSVKQGAYGSVYTADEIRALDGTGQGYGQGVNMDENNRPTGATMLQDKYGKYGAVFIADDSKQIYLTLDEGYENGYSGKILDVLKEKNCNAVFFVTMDFVEKNPDLISRMIEEGHVIGNHSVNHKSMPTLSLEDASYEITGLHEYMLEHYNYEMYLFRPPMGEFSEQTLALAQSLGYRTMLWSYAYRDYDTENQPEAAEALSKVTAAKHGGAVYLLHAVSATNTQIMPDVIDDFRNSGYTVGAFPR